MSADRADPEVQVQVGGKQDLRKRCALISASVLIVTAGAMALYRGAPDAGAALAAAGVGLRRLQGRRLPHYTTYGGTSYDFAPRGVPTSTCCCTSDPGLEMDEVEGRGAFVLIGPVDRIAAGPGAGLTGPIYQPTVAPIQYNPTMPPRGIEYNPTMPPGTGVFPGAGVTGPVYQPTVAPGQYQPTMAPKGTVVGNPGTGVFPGKTEGYEDVAAFRPRFGDDPSGCICTDRPLDLEQPMTCKMTFEP